MKFRQFGNTSLVVSEIGFGAWAIGGGAMIGETAIGWGDVEDGESVKAIHAALDAGINFFDTADIYGLGHSESIIGKTIGTNKEVIIATKGGNVNRNNQFTIDYSEGHLIRACEDSLRRLRRDTIDYYQLHSARLNHLEEGTCIKTMELLQKQGKIRYWGLSLNSFEPLPEANFLMETEKGSGFQLVLNLLNQLAVPLLSPAHKKGYGIIARMPLQFGLLTGKFDDHVSFPVNDHRKKRLTPELVTAANKALQPVWELCKKYECSKSALALGYILSYPEVSVVIPGIRTINHVSANRYYVGQLAREDKEMIEDLGNGKFNEVMELIKNQG